MSLYKNIRITTRFTLKALFGTCITLLVGLHGLLITYKWVNPPITNMMLIDWWRSDKKMPLHNLRNTWCSLKQLSPHLIPATLSSEDGDFFHHKGFHLDAMWEALNQDLHNIRPQGTSTITQQTVKNVLLYPHKSYFRKILELYFSCLLELLWGKERILEVYLNVIELGKGIYGVQQGTRHHFSKSASHICFDEACLLAAIISNPKYLDPLNPNAFVYYKASFIFRKGIATARKTKTDFPCLSGRHNFY